MQQASEAAAAEATASTATATAATKLMQQQKQKQSLMPSLERTVLYMLVAGMMTVNVYQNHASTFASLNIDSPTNEEQQKPNIPYVPSTSEQYVMDHATELGYDDPTGEAAIGCHLFSFFLEDKYDESNLPAKPRIEGGYRVDVMKDWLTEGLSKPVASKLHPNLQLFDQYLTDYANAVKEFEPVPDLMESIQNEHKNGRGTPGINSVCKTLKLHPDGLPGIFPIGDNNNDNEQLLGNSNPPLNHHPYLSHNPRSGYIEPLLPPMRYHGFCNYRNIEPFYHLMTLDYLIHDFETMCETLKPTSRRIFIDMGASLAFHDAEEGTSVPVIELLHLYEKFGFKFDHIYGFEVTFQPPEDVFGKLLPEEYLSNYHWINVGVSSEEGHRLNPLNSIISQFDEDDFIVVKLDIDTASVEYPLALQILNDMTYHNLIDQFYFEHHVHLAELSPWWGITMEGTVNDSLKLFHNMRQKGVPAHFWP